LSTYLPKSTSFVPAGTDLGVKLLMDRAFTPSTLMEFAVMHGPTKFEHYANPMVHPVMSETILSYKKLMNNLTTAEVWQTAFCKDLGCMAQGDNKMGQKGTNAMFVMTHNEIAHVLQRGKYSNTQIPLSITDPKKKTPTTYESQLGEI
jgi:hypothetical protein